MISAPLPLSRRDALKRVLGLSLALSALELTATGAATPTGLGADPDLLKKVIPWDRVLTAPEMRIVTALGDLIIPADEHGPAASAVGVPDFINEWVSAPYEAQQRDAKIIRDGLAWLDAEARQRFGQSFADTPAEQQTALLDDIVAEGTAARKAAYGFFTNFRDKVTGGYYTTTEGWKALGYVGNVPLPEFPAPPAELLKHLGLA